MESEKTPREGLDEAKRSIILTLLKNGSSRRTAALFVGCSPSTITRTANRDPKFTEQILQAEQNAEIEALRCIRTAAKNERYWRAAAWLLERKNPADFALRPPTLFTIEQVRQLFISVTDLLAEELPEKNRERAIQKLHGMMALCEEAKAERLRCKLPLPPPVQSSEQPNDSRADFPFATDPDDEVEDSSGWEEEPSEGQLADPPQV